jgi:hypothetical protein
MTWWFWMGWADALEWGYRLYLEKWRYRHADPEVCCCGSQLGHGGDICYHGGCRSMKEYAVTGDIEKWKGGGRMKKLVSFLG